MEQIIAVLKEIDALINDQTDISETAYDSATEIKEDLEIFIECLEDGMYECIDDLSIHFLPQSTFNALALQNGYLDKYQEWNSIFELNKKNILK